MPDSPHFVDVVIAAAGTGERLGADTPKAFVQIAGVPMVQHALRAAAAAGARRVVVMVPEGQAEAWRARVGELADGVQVDAVAGGETRQASVRRGLEFLAAQDTDDRPGVVLVHDAARPGGSVELWNRVAAAAAKHGAAVPALASVDSLKEVGAGGTLVGAVDRERIVRVQTPQGFRFAELLEAHRAAHQTDTHVTDDAAIFELAGRAVATVPGEEANFKVTTPQDKHRIEQVLGGVGNAGRVRIGYGYDTHPLVAGRSLVLGGVQIAHDRGLDGHSDADALAHAVTDAVLGAAGLGDIGQQFPADNPQWKDADSMVLLATVIAEVATAGFCPHNVDATILAEEPRLLPHLQAMGHRLAETMGLPDACVNVKATRGEGMGPIGRGEGIAAHAVVTVYPI